MTDQLVSSMTMSECICLLGLGSHSDGYYVLNPGQGLMKNKRMHGLCLLRVCSWESTLEMLNNSIFSRV